MPAWIAQHRKLLAAVAGAVVTVVVQVWGTTTPWVTALVLIATAAGVYAAPNAPRPAPVAPALPGTGGGGPEPVPEHVAGSTGLPPSAFPAA
jgi:hypothetical protein